MDELEKRIRLRLRDDFKHYAQKCLKVRTKAGVIVPFVFNKAQDYFHEIVEKQKREKGLTRIIVVKGRQLGLSTYISGFNYHGVTNHVGLKAFILTHRSDATDNLFRMAKRYHKFCPEVVRAVVTINNSKELNFEGLDSGYKVGTAESKALGRSDTLQYFHGSEVAYWPNAEEHARGILQSIAYEPGTAVFLESTANGPGNFFHQQWQLAEAGQSDYIPIFIPWFWDEKYRREAPLNFTMTPDEEELVQLYGLDEQQLMFRRSKVVDFTASGIDGVKFFRQEYPCNSVEAFQFSGEDSYIPPALVMRARKCVSAEPYGPLVVGVDPARFGDDRTGIIRRRGRVAYNLQTYKDKDTMQVVGLVHQIIIEEKPDKVCIDIGGLGAGIVDRLKELGHGAIVVGVNSGESAYNEKKYQNKRGEMWGNTRAWLEDEPCQIPDSDSLHADLCGAKYDFTSNTQLILETKKQMKKRGIRSPDEADALCLTFALPPSALVKSIEKNNKEIARSFASTSSQVDKLRRAAYK